MNGYCRLSHVKADITGLSGITTIDAELARGIEEESRIIDAYVRRFFYSRLATRYFERRPNTCRERLRLVGETGQAVDVISISALTIDDDEDYDYDSYTLTENTHYWLTDRWSPNEGPYAALELIPGNTTLSTWPMQRRGIKVVCLEGFSQDTEAGGTTAEALDASETGVDMTAGHGTEIGDTLIIDSEQMDVNAVSTDTLTVTRGINGTVAATHLTGATVLRRRFPKDIERACKDAVVRRRWNVQSGFTGQAMEDPLANRGSQFLYEWRRLLNSYRLPVVP